MSKVNLLPPEHKDEIEQAKKNSKIVSITFKISLLIFVVVGIYATAFFYLSNTLEASNTNLTEREKEVDQFQNLEEESRKVSERLNLISAIDKLSPRWSGSIVEIQNIMPSGVYLSSVKMDEKKGNRNQISGYAQTKKEVAALRNLMEESTKFEYVDIENSTTVNDPKTRLEVESFSLSFAFEKGALK